MSNQLNSSEDRSMLAWSFVREDCMLQDSTNLSMKPGITLIVPAPLIMGEHGLHASVDPLDALYYGSGSTICRVELAGTILEETDRLCADRCTVIWMAYVSKALHEFACWCAEEALQEADKAGCVLPHWTLEAIGARKAWLAGTCSDRDIAHICLDMQYNVRQALQDDDMSQPTVEQAAYKTIQAVMHQNSDGTDCPVYNAGETARLMALIGVLSNTSTPRAKRKQRVAIQRKQNTTLKKMLFAAIR